MELDAPNQEMSRDRRLIRTPGVLRARGVDGEEQRLDAPDNRTGAGPDVERLVPVVVAVPHAPAAA